MNSYMNKRQRQLYAGAKAAITRATNRKLIECFCQMRFASVAAIKAVNTRKMRELDRMFGKL